MRSLALGIALIVLPVVTGAGELKPVVHSEMGSVLGTLHEISAHTPDDQPYSVRIFEVPARIGECNGDVATCPDVRLLFTVSAGDPGDEPVLYELPVAKGWTFKGWTRLGPPASEPETRFVVETALPDDHIDAAARQAWRGQLYKVMVSPNRASYERQDLTCAPLSLTSPDELPAPMVPDEPLSLDALAALSPYVGSAPQHDTVYDGKILALTTRAGPSREGRPSLAEASMDILGPYEDVLYRITLTGVRDITLPNTSFHPPFGDIKALEIAPLDDGGRRLTVTFLGTPAEISVTFREGAALRRRLTKTVRPTVLHERSPSASADPSVCRRPVCADIETLEWPDSLFQAMLVRHRSIDRVGNAIRG